MEALKWEEAFPCEAGPGKGRAGRTEKRKKLLISLLIFVKNLFKRVRM